MKKTAIILASIFILIALTAFTSAYTFTIPETGSFSFYQQQPTVYQYNPTVNSNYNSINDGSSAWNYNYQGPLAEKTTNYNEFLQINRRGKVTYTVSATSNEKYVGAQLVQNAQSQYNNGVTQTYQSAAPQTYTNGGNTFLWRQAPSITSYDYTRTEYGSPYYYSPQYSDGYYNWRY